MKRPANDEEFHSIFPVENEELVYGRWEDEVIWDHEHMPVKIEPKMVIYFHGIFCFLSSPCMARKFKKVQAKKKTREIK